MAITPQTKSLNRTITYYNQLANSGEALIDATEDMLEKAKISEGFLGQKIWLDGFDCNPTAPASLYVEVGPGTVFLPLVVDATPFGTAPSQIAADTTHVVEKMGFNLDVITPNVGPFTPPATIGYSQNYLIQINAAEADGDPQNLPFWASTNQNGVPNPPVFQTVNVHRIISVNVSIKPGTPAPTGTQTTPAPDVGYAGAWVITVTEGQTTVISSNIAKYIDTSNYPDDVSSQNTAFLDEKLPAKISLATGDARYALKSEGAETGDVTFSILTSKAGWVLLNDGTIGNAVSGATNRANADTQALFTFIWNNILDAWCPVSGGRGASAAADFAANKTIQLPLIAGRSIAAAGSGSVMAQFTADSSSDLLTLASTQSFYTGTAVQVSNSGGALPSPLAPATTYYVINQSGTTIKLATTLANAVAGAAIDITTNGTGTQTITITLTTRQLGEYVGEETHASTVAETANHGHGNNDFDGTGGIVEGGGGNPVNYGPSQTTLVGGSQAHNNMQPTSFLNAFMKL